MRYPALWNVRPATAATLPKPAETVKISTQSIVGTALMKATILLVTLPTVGFAMFLAHSKAPKKAMIAPEIVESAPNENTVSKPHIAPLNVICVSWGEPNMVLAFWNVPNIAFAKSIFL
jgi:hypothetical protein